MQAKDLPCFDCLENCEAKLWLKRAHELDKGGLTVETINLPCPQNGVTYIISKGES